VTADDSTLDARPLAINECESSTEPQPSSYAQALKAWNRGDHDATLSVVEFLPTSRQSSESLLLCARALIRKNRLTDAREWLNRSVSGHRTPDNHATQLMLQGVIEARERNVPRAEALFARALQLKPHHRLRAEINYERALVHFAAQRHSDARSTLRAIRPYADIVSVRAIELEGWIHSASGDYRSAHAAFGTALTALDKCAAIDMSLRASLLCEFSEMVAELDNDQGDRLVHEADRIAWGQSVVREQVQTLRYIGLVHRRAGRLGDAMRLFGEASSIAPGSPWQILGVAECACLCIDQDNSWAASGYVAQAQRLAEQIEWATVVGEQRVALLVLAQALARLKDGVAAARLKDGVAARTLLDLYRGTSQLPGSDGDDRLSTYAQHTIGLVHAACGDVAIGRGVLSGVHLAWSRLGYRWRAIDALNDIKRIDPRRMPDWLLNGASNVHHQMLAGNERTSTRAGNEISGVELKERFARQYNISLSLADILQLTVRGRSNKEIALEVDDAERTVKNKVNQLYRIVGVKTSRANSRAKLVARCMADIAARGISVSAD
jgi:tetratricopeptide (TPR) repeat protein